MKNQVHHQQQQQRDSLLNRSPTRLERKLPFQSELRHKTEQHHLDKDRFDSRKRNEAPRQLEFSRLAQYPKRDHNPFKFIILEGQSNTLHSSYAKLMDRDLASKNSENKPGLRLNLVKNIEPNGLLVTPNFINSKYGRKLVNNARAHRQVHSLKRSHSKIREDITKRKHSPLLPKKSLKSHFKVIHVQPKARENSPVNTLQLSSVGDATSTLNQRQNFKEKFMNKGQNLNNRSFNQISLPGKITKLRPSRNMQPPASQINNNAFIIPTSSSNHHSSNFSLTPNNFQTQLAVGQVSKFSRITPTDSQLPESSTALKDSQSNGFPGVEKAILKIFIPNHEIRFKTQQRSATRPDQWTSPAFGAEETIASLPTVNSVSTRDFPAGEASQDDYNFTYAVRDAEEGLNYGHSEVKQGGVASGEYFVALPDGRTQRVRYTV